MKEKVLSIIDDIEAALENNSSSYHGVGGSDGLLGKAIFFLYKYWSSSSSTDGRDKIVEVLNTVLERLNSKYASIRPQHDILEVGMFLCLLNNRTDIAVEKSLLEEFDEIILEALKLKISKQDLDPLNGAIAFANYFLERKNAVRRLDAINNTEELLIDQLELSNGRAFWKFKLRDEDHPYIELNASHGVAGVLGFLYKLSKSRVSNFCHRKTLIAGVEFLLANRRIGRTCQFPGIVGEEVARFSNLLYGDLGIGYNVYNIGKFLERHDYQEAGIEILLNAALYKEEHRLFIREANMIYGASGIYLAFDLFYKRIGKIEFLQAREYWLDQIESFRKKENQWGGFQTYMNGGYPHAQIGLSQGITGIATAYLSAELPANKSILKLYQYDC